MILRIALLFFPMLLSAQSTEFVPQWAKKAVWYQIFPERFRNGDPSNDPKVSDLQGADPQDPPKAWNIHPWGSDWYKLQPYEIQNGEPELWKHLLRRRYGGDLQGIIDKLDYLKDLGINAIYLNPIFDAPSLHKYDGASYHHIDPNFGPDPAGDRALMATENPLNPDTWVWTKADELALKLIEECHKRKIRIIFDGVFNHMGINSFAFQDVLKNQEKSAYKDWFTIKSFENAITGTRFDYEGWFGVKSLPELREDENGIAEAPKAYIFAATQRWMNPKNNGVQFGIDGWRLDVAFCVQHQFWKDWRRHVKQINPQAYLTAELILPPHETQKYLEGDEFDGEMNYNFAFLSSEFFFNNAITANEFDFKLKELRNLYPQGVAYVLQNLFNSHDSSRIASHIVNRGIGHYGDWGRYFGLSKPLDNPKYQQRKPNAIDIRLQKLFLAFQMTYVGAPMIYYGDEVGMWGGNDPDCRKPMLWEDIRYEHERYNVDGNIGRNDPVRVNRDLRRSYQQLIQIRNRNIALQLGDFNPLFAEGDVYIFERNYEGQKIVVALNRSLQSKRIPYPLQTSALDLRSGRRYGISTKEIRLEGLGFSILLAK